MELVQKPISELKPYDKNPRVNDKAVDYVANSIKEFGFKVPIVIDKDGVIVAGHTRLKAAEKLGLESVPTITADDLTDEQIKAFRIADNKTAEFSEWNFDFLAEEIQDINDIDMSLFGVDLSAFDEEPEIEEDDFSENDDIPQMAQLGDVFKLGGAQVDMWR